jgi:mannitol/fructose-specific phosphotransferase system IIA component (Ntr-type)
MMIYGMLSDAAFNLELRSSCVEGAIGELADQLAYCLGDEEPTLILAELREREQLRKAAGDGEFALLHAITPRVERLGLAFGRSPAGLYQEAVDSPLVHFVCVVLIPPHQRSTGFRALNGLALLLREPMVRTQLLWTETPEEALALCRQASGRRWVALASWLKDRLATALRPSAAAGARGERA